MRKSILFFLMISLILSSNLSSADDIEIMYTESIESHTRLDDENFNWASEREFAFYGYSLGIGSQNETVAIVKLLDSSNYGQAKEVEYPYRSVNFIMNVSYLANSSLSEITWSILPVRDAETGGSSGQDPFPSDEKIILTTSGHRRFDLKSNYTYFSVNLQYYEYINVTGQEMIKVKTNVELTTNNNEDGTIIRSSIHIIKRTSEADIIYEYDHSIQKVSSIDRFFNIFDQPYLLVPYQYAIIIVIVLGYNRLYRYVSKYDIKITKKVNDEIENDGSEITLLE